jgi:hypothetical protein
MTLTCKEPWWVWLIILLIAYIVGEILCYFTINIIGMFG